MLSFKLLKNQRRILVDIKLTNRVLYNKRADNIKSMKTLKYFTWILRFSDIY